MLLAQDCSMAVCHVICDRVPRSGRIGFVNYLPCVLFKLLTSTGAIICTDRQPGTEIGRGRCLSFWLRR